MNKRRLLGLVGTVALIAGAASAGQEIAGLTPISLHPENPHYFLFRGQPTILITSGEHYGAVLNLDFDYGRYLDELKAHGFNLTRTFSGTYREIPGSFNITGNTLAPAEGRFLCPWARSSTPGASDGGNKFDLRAWDEAYFRRLKDFVAGAAKRGVVVELVLFCTMYDDALWEASPMNARNNINGSGNVGREEVYALVDRELSDAQEALARKLAAELNGFDNAYYEICNEPYERGGFSQAWNRRIIEAIVDAESTLLARHMIAENAGHGSLRIEEPNPHISVFNFHAARPESVTMNFDLNRPIASDETGGSDQSDRKYRTDGWRFIFAGGSVYSHLDFSFTTERPDGSAVPLPPGTPGGGGPELRRQLQALKEFIERFEFIRMAPDDPVIKQVKVIEGPAAKARALAQPGKAYAVYVEGGSQVELTLILGAGDYAAEWVSTKTGAVELSTRFRHEGGDKLLASPIYLEDIALRVRSVE